MKHSIDWHIECVNNMKDYHIRQTEDIERRKKDANRLLDDIFELERQINIAADRGLKEFDREKLGKKRNKKT
jgi:hypothetical protein